MSKKISLPQSAHECAASAVSDADPVTAAAADFATAIRRLAPKATSTVMRLSDAAGPRSNGTGMSGSRDPRATPPAATDAWSPPCSRAINHS